VCETFKTVVHAPGMSGSRRNCRFENRIGAGSIGKAHRRRRKSAPWRSPSTTSRGRTTRSLIATGYVASAWSSGGTMKDGDTDVRGDSVRDATGGERRSAP
jgi:hypothetical protein